MTSDKNSGLSVTIVRKTIIDELIHNFDNFSFLKDLSIPEDESVHWEMEDKDIYCIQAMFIGKTGYGKSTTLNKICGKELFKTDDINSCTKTVFSAEYRLKKRENHYFSLCDLPGMGESISSDKKYAKYYYEMLEKSHCVIYVMRADQRDYSQDFEILKPMVENKKEKVILAVNFADKIEPVTRSEPFNLSKKQMENINEKLSEIQRLFKIPKRNIIFYSAKEEFNLDKIVNGITDILKRTVKRKCPSCGSEKVGLASVANIMPKNSDGYYISFIQGEFADRQLRGFYAFDHCHDKTSEQIDAYVEKARKEYERWLKNGFACKECGHTWETHDAPDIHRLRQIPACTTKLYVGNLSYNTTEDDLRNLFTNYGTVASAKIIYDRETSNSKGFGFIEMSTNEEAGAAIVGINGQEFEGRQIRVNEAVDKPIQERSRRANNNWW
jgi:small GTP-binding protein